MVLRILGSYFLIFFCAVVIPTQAHAGLWGELGFYMGNDGLESASSASSSRSYYNFDMYGNLDNNNKYFLGFHVHQMGWSSSQGNADEEQFSTMDMGPSFMWVIDEKQRFDVYFAYNVSAKATYNDGTDEASLKGTSFLASIGFQPEIKEPWRIGFRLNYYSATFTERRVDGDATDVSYTRTWMYPSIVFSYRK